ncbi:MAG: DNA polymerase domain-containing protein [archaeon]
MRALFIDAWRAGDKIAVWLKTPDENIRIVKEFQVSVYVKATPIAWKVLDMLKLQYTLLKKRTYCQELKKVYEIRISRLSAFETIVHNLELAGKHDLVMHNADISPEQMFIYASKLTPFCPVDIIDEKIIPLDQEAAIPLEKMTINILCDGDLRSCKDISIKSIFVYDQLLSGSEKEILERFVKLFIAKDPDVIIIENAFTVLPFLYDRLKFHKLDCPFHRWDPKPIKRKGGKTFFSYGKVMHRDYAIRLNGRFLLDSGTVVGTECDIEGIIELCQLSGTRFQQISSRSFGAVFQSSLIKEMIKRDYLVPFKEKPADIPISMKYLLKADRVGHTFDSLTGMHKDVAEIDFSSLFPWIIYNYNISTETLYSEDLPLQDVPGLPFSISLRRKGIIPIAIKPMLDRRMHYKKNPTTLNKVKIQGLKWVLVTSYGYLRFREFKLGIASSHMAIGAFAREILLKAKSICEEHGLKIVHGIVDSLYIQKQGITEKEVREICREIELAIGIPLSFEGIFKWIVFLPSVSDITRPVPTRYYGLFKNGELKVRGIELRQAGVPRIVKYFQKMIMETMSQCNNKEEIMDSFPIFCSILKKTISILPNLASGDLSSFIRISKTHYKSNIPQKISIDLLKKNGVSILPGQKISFIYSDKGVVLPEQYSGNPNIDRYKQLLVRSLYVLIQPFGFTKDQIKDMIADDRQTILDEYNKEKLAGSMSPQLQSIEI